MRALNNLGLKKLKIHFEYSTTQRITILAEPYKTIKEMKAKALKQIFPMPNCPRLFYLNKEITSYENEQVGTYFAGKSLIIIKIVSGDSDNGFGISLGIGIGGIGIGEYNDELCPLSISNKNQMHNESNDTNNVSLMTHESKRPDIHLMNSNPEYTCMCRNEYVMYYCRNCREFLCHQCRLNKKHKAHLTIHVDTKNLEESIRLYAMIVQTDIETNIQSSQDFYAKFKNNTHLETASRQEEVFTKLEEVARRYNDIMTIIETRTNTMNEIPLVISEFNLNSKIINGEIDNILNEVYSIYSKTKKKMGYDQFKSYFHLINSKERDWDGMTQDVMKYKINSEINGKINRMYEKINGAIDELLNDANPFMLEEKSLSALNDLRSGIEIGIGIENEEGNFKEMNSNHNSHTNNHNINHSNLVNVALNKMIKTRDNNNTNEDNDEIGNNNNNNNTDEDERRKREAKVLLDKTKRQMKKKKDIEEKEIKEIQDINEQYNENSNHCNTNRQNQNYNHNNGNETETGKEKEKKNHSEQQTQNEDIKIKSKENKPIVFDEYKAPNKKRRK